MTTLWSRDREIQEIARKVPDPLSMKAGSGNETNYFGHFKVEMSDIDQEQLTFTFYKLTFYNMNHYYNEPIQGRNYHEASEAVASSLKSRSSVLGTDTILASISRSHDSPSISHDICAPKLWLLLES